MPKTSAVARDFISKKIVKLRKEGYPLNQSVAIAYDYARRKGMKVPKRTRVA